MSDYYVSWFDTTGYEPRRTFEMIETPPEMLTEERELPAGANFDRVYIRWHRQQFGQDQLHLLTFTHHEPGADEVSQLLGQAIKFIQEREQ